MSPPEIADPTFREALGDAGADLDAALPAGLAHREAAAAERLLERGATLTLPAAVCPGRAADIPRLGRMASIPDRQAALACATLYGQAETLATSIGLGVDVNGFSPPGFHPHGTALHHAVDSGSLETVKVLVEAGAELHTRDRAHNGTPLDWAEFLQRPRIAAYLREKGSPP